MSTSDLLADLQLDRHRPAQEARRREPALELRVTPLRWSAPRLASADGRWTLVLGPVQAAVQHR